MTDRSTLTYRGDGKRGPGADPTPWMPTRPDLYRPSTSLVHAVNVALLLGKPLLVTGEPGTGKTHLAQAVAWDLGLDRPLVFDTRSSSEWKHLFYRFDALARLQSAYPGPGGVRETIDPREFVQYEALGKAVLRTHADDDVVRELIPVKAKHVGPIRSLVLVDEIDKAPRDFPNDLLGAIERMEFTVAELHGATVTADARYLPVVIATSNSENVLPEAFLRRCIYHHLDFPTGEQLQAIVTSRALAAVDRLLKRKVDERLVDAATKLFFVLREAKLRKTPATAELIEWVTALHAREDCRDGKLTLAAVRDTLGVIVKRKEDIEDALKAFEDHANDPGRTA